jgi:ribosome biogenesis protein ENP2
MSNINSL